MLMRESAGVQVLGASVCVMCGDPIPEGRQVCPICEDEVQQRAFEELMAQSQEEDEAHDG